MGPSNLDGLQIMSTLPGCPTSHNNLVILSAVKCPSWHAFCSYFWHAVCLDSLQCLEDHKPDPELMDCS